MVAVRRFQGPRERYAENIDVAERPAISATALGGALRQARCFFSAGLRPIPRPCLGCGSETSSVTVGVSWDASREPLRSSCEGSWALLGASLGRLSSLLGASMGLLGASRGFLGASWRSGGPFRGGELEVSVRVLLRGALLGGLGGVLGASWAVLGLSGAVSGRFGGALGLD